MQWCATIGTESASLPVRPLNAAACRRLGSSTMEVHVVQIDRRGTAICTDVQHASPTRALPVLVAGCEIQPPNQPRPSVIVRG